jgi:hypothetical protein
MPVCGQESHAWGIRDRPPRADGTSDRGRPPACGVQPRRRVGGADSIPAVVGPSRVPWRLGRVVRAPHRGGNCGARADAARSVGLGRSTWNSKSWTSEFADDPRRWAGHREGGRVFKRSLTGVPQVSVPGTDVDGLPVGLSIFGARDSDTTLVAVARAPTPHHLDRRAGRSLTRSARCGSPPGAPTGGPGLHRPRGAAA